MLDYGSPPMSKELIDNLNKLADTIEQIDNIHAPCTASKAAHTIERLTKENEEYRALLLKMDENPKTVILKQIGLYYTYN